MEFKEKKKRGAPFLLVLRRSSCRGFNFSPLSLFVIRRLVMSSVNKKKRVVRVWGGEAHKGRQADRQATFFVPLAFVSWAFLGNLAWGKIASRTT
jgi:hypothetical protein